MSTGPTRMLALGLDALDPLLVEAWAADGTLPNLGALMERGLSGRLRGIEGFYVGSTWPSTYTGRSPAGHGMHYELQLLPGTYDLHRVQGGERGNFVRAETLWGALGRQGRRMAVLDVPLSEPTDDIEGAQVVEWGGHDHFFGFHATPPELERRLRERWRRHPHGVTCDVRRGGVEDYADFIDRMESGVTLKTRWVHELLARGGWDLFLAVYTEGHCVGHQCWHIHDPGHPAHDPAMAAALGDPLRRIYRALDGAVGRLVEAAGEAPVLVWSSHGMSHWRGASFLLPEILVALGVSNPWPPGAGRKDAPVVRRVARGLWRRLPRAAKVPVRRLVAGARALRGRQPSAERSNTVPRLAVDAENSLCFPVRNGSAVSGIRLNLAGREPAGRLQPGAEADEFCARLRADLLEIVDERTGGPLIRRVVRTADLYEGPHLDLLPDLLVEWSDEVPTGSTIVGDGAAAHVRVHSPVFGSLEGRNDYCRTGDHRPRGWFVAAGGGIAPGRLEREISVLDIAPTIAAMLEAEMPEADGRPVPELVSSPRAAASRRDGAR